MPPKRETALLQDRAAEVAGSVSHRLSVEFDSTEILASGRRTVIRLQPAPIVVKVAAVSQYHFLEKEVAVARHVAAAGGPAVPPLHGLAAGPHREAEFAVTLWHCLPAGTSPSDIESAGARAYCQLREVLDSCAGDLPDYTLPILECARVVRSGSVPRSTASQMASRA
jgi:hypothetical protein